MLAFYGVVEMVQRMVTGWLTYRDLEAQTGVAQTTLRRFVERFPMFVAGRLVDRKMTFPPETAATVRRIAELYASGKNTKDILATLTVEMAATIDVQPVTEPMGQDMPAEAQGHLVAVLDRLATAMERQAAALELLAERMPALKGQERAVEASGNGNQGEGRPGNENALETPWWRLWLRRLIG